MDYIILEELFPNELVFKVKRYMTMGYVPCGGLVFHNDDLGRTMYCQAMMKSGILECAV